MKILTQKVWDQPEILHFEAPSGADAEGVLTTI
jgi:hypothetical protein